MNQKIINIFKDPIFSVYQEKKRKSASSEELIKSGNHKGIGIDSHNRILRLSPAEYTDRINPASNEKKIISKLEVYKSIFEAYLECKAKNLCKPHLPLGFESHKVAFTELPVGLNKKTYIYLDIKDTKLDSFKALIDRSECDCFKLGRVPYHSKEVYQGITSFLFNRETKLISKISSVFHRKRDDHPRVYVSITINNLILGARKEVSIDLYD